MGRRVTKNAQSFVYDGYLQIANFELVLANSQITSHNSQLFIWDPTEPVATRPLAWLVLSGLDGCGYYTHDGSKNVSEVIANEVDVSAHYEYEPFGAVLVACGESVTANPWRFSSEYADNALGLVYYNYRHYEPIFGRWIGRDSIEEKGGVNLYASCNNNLGSWVDSKGKVNIRIVAGRNYSVDVGSSETVPVYDAQMWQQGEFSIGKIVLRENKHTKHCVDILLPVSIVLNSSLDKTNRSGSSAGYYNHTVGLDKNYDWIVVTKGSNYGHPRALVLAHERAHARAFFEFVVPWMKDTPLRLINAMTNPTKEKIRESAAFSYNLMRHNRVYNQKSADYANETTHAWFVSNDYVLEKQDGDAFLYRKQ